MSCSACSNRRQRGKIVPVTPSRARAIRNNDGKSAVEKGNNLRNKLRFTGRD